MPVFQASLFLRLATTLPSVAVRDVSNVSEGAPNDRILPNSPEVSQMVFSMRSAKPVWFTVFGATLKTTVYLFGLSKGNFGRLENKVAFSSDRKLLAIP